MLFHKLAVFLNRFKERPNARRNSWISKEAVIPKSCIIGERVKIKGIIKMGENCFVNDDTVIGGKVFIGDGCRIENKAMIGSCNSLGTGKLHNPPLFPLNRCVAGEQDSVIKIGDWVAIEAGSIISKGVTIGDKAIITVGSVVFDNVPEKAIVKGNPAVVVGYRNFDNTKIV